MKLSLFVGMAVMAFPAARANEEAALDAIASLPKCAMSCLLPLVASSPCVATNVTCICGNKKLIADMAICVTEACSIKEILHTKNITLTSCGAPVRDQSRKYVVMSNTLGIISATFVVQRFVYKIWTNTELGLDDWFTLVTLVSGVPSTIMNAVALTPNGMGRDVWTLTPVQITRFFVFFFVMEILYYFQVAVLKLALLLFYIRIFPASPVQRLLWGTIAFTAVYGLVFVFLGCFPCHPVRYFWTRWDGQQSGSCLNINGLAWSNAVISIVLDIWMLAIPLWQLSSLNLDLKRKIGVGIMFCLGTFITIISILRLRSLVKFETDATNPTWEFFSVGVWSTVEINIGLICTCMPTVRLFLVRLFPGRLGTTYPHRAKNSKTNNASSNSRKSQSEKPPPQWTNDGFQYHKSCCIKHNDKDDAERGPCTHGEHGAG